MVDNKTVNTVIKTLERAIGILENSIYLGEFPEKTRKRIIEMLNTATMDIYFLGTNSVETNASDVPVEKPAEKQPVAEKIVPEEDKFISEDEFEPSEKTVIPEIAEEQPETLVEDLIQDKPVAEQPEELPPLEEIEIQVTAPQPEIVEQPAKIVLQEEEFEIVENLIVETEIEPEPEPEVVAEPVVPQQPSIDNSDKPLFEWETEETIKAKNEIEALKNHLDEERKRLERELKDWQDEKQKREEEMIAAKKLLETLQQQQQQIVPPPQTNWKDEPIIREPIVHEPIAPAPSPIPPVQPAHEPIFVKPEPKPEPKPKPVEKPQETLIDSYIGSKKVLYENFETNDVVMNQISTPISSLAKAIGINDRFRFIKELFGGDFDLYCETIDKLDKAGSLGAGISYIESVFSWDKNSDAVKQFISLIRRRYM